MTPEQIEQVLAEHLPSKAISGCACGARRLARPLPDPGEFEAAWAAHVAAEIVRALGLVEEHQWVPVAESGHRAVGRSLAALDEAIRAIRAERDDRLSQMERNGMKVAELVVREVRRSLTEGREVRS
jgi:hypothetical protein